MSESHLVHVRGRREGEKHVQAGQLPPLRRYKKRCCPVDGYLGKMVILKKDLCNDVFSENGLNNDVFSVSCGVVRSQLRGR